MSCGEKNTYTSKRTNWFQRKSNNTVFSEGWNIPKCRFHSLLYFPIFRHYIPLTITDSPTPPPPSRCFYSISTNFSTLIYARKETDDSVDTYRVTCYSFLHEVDLHKWKEPKLQLDKRACHQPKRFQGIHERRLLTLNCQLLTGRCRKTFFGQPTYMYASDLELTVIDSPFVHFE